MTQEVSGLGHRYLNQPIQMSLHGGDSISAKNSLFFPELYKLI